MQVVLDFSKAGLLAAVKRFGAHALIAAVVAGLADLYAQLSHVSISDHTAIASVLFTLVVSAVHNGLAWATTQKAAEDAAGAPDIAPQTLDSPLV